LFNLFVTAKTDAWNQGAYQFGHDRVIQGYSDKSSTARFVDLEDRSVKAELASFPCLLVYEEGMDETVTIGWLTKISPRDAGVRIEFAIENDLPPISRGDIKPIKAQLDIASYELGTTHWSVKDIDLLAVLVKAGVLSEEDINRQGGDSRLVRLGLHTPVTELHIRPTVFRVPPIKPASDLVSVMMPFEMAFNGVYNSIRAACEEASLCCKRADDIWNEAGSHPGRVLADLPLARRDLRFLGPQSECFL
jgi:hypothetical protein